MENLNLHCRMYRSRYPQIGMPVMIQVNNIDEQGADVSLLEYNGKNGRINEQGAFVEGRIGPAVVISVDGGILLSRTSNTLASIHDCEARYYRARYVQRILREVAIALGRRLKSVYRETNWPTYEELMLYLEDRSANYWSNLPSDLKRVLRQKLKTITITSWRLMNPSVLSFGSVIIPGNVQLCWAFALVRQFEAKLKLNGMVAMDFRLSVQDLVNKTSREYLDDLGDIVDLEDAIWALSWGIVEERYCPLIFSADYRGSTASDDVPLFRISGMKVYRDFDYPNNWEKLIEEAVLTGPVTVTVLWFPSYSQNRGGKQVYKPTDREWNIYEANPDVGRRLSSHVMLLTGCDTNVDGTKLWELQDNISEESGDRGFVYYARDPLHPCLIVEFVDLIF